MKVKIKIDKDYEKPLCVIYTSEVSDEINEYLKLLSKSSEKTLTGRSGEDIVIIKPDEINNIYTANGKIFAVTSRGEYSVNTRLYKLEEMLDSKKFVRISNSEIINLNEVCLLYTSDAADDMQCVYLGGRRIIKKKIF